MVSTSLLLSPLGSARNHASCSRLVQNRIPWPLVPLQQSLRSESHLKSSLNVSSTAAKTSPVRAAPTQFRSFVRESHSRLTCNNQAVSPPAIVLLDAKGLIWGPRESRTEVKPAQGKHFPDRPKGYDFTKINTQKAAAPAYTSSSTKFRSIIGSSSGKLGSRITARPVPKRPPIPTALTLKYESRVEPSDGRQTLSHPAFIILNHSRPIWGPRIMSTELEIWTDGACSNNGKRTARAGYGVFFGLEDPKNEAGRVPGLQTNNRGELFGIIRALELAQNETVSTVKVYTDSQYAIRCIAKWISTWIRDGGLNSRKEPAANYSMLRYLDVLVHHSSAKVVLDYVRSKKDRGNKCADKLAVKAAATIDLCPAECDWDEKRTALVKVLGRRQTKRMEG